MDSVEQLFERWLDEKVCSGEVLDPAELCADRPELLPELEALIERFLDLDGVLPSPSRVDQTATGGALDLQGETAEPTLESYRIVGLLGRGGMGEAWEAEQLSPVRRPVALKVIRRGQASASVIRRFAAERQALAAMDHPAIAKIFDAGATEEGRPFFAMELVRGEPIDRFADRHRLDIRRRLELFTAVCDGVEHAHRRGLIHRDLKPSNILVSLREEGSSETASSRFEPKLIDFGIAKAMSTEPSGDSVLTVAGQLVGTPAYMSPEQADLGHLDIDTRSDVYALGIVLYQLLVGVLPFGAEAWFRRPEDPDPELPSVRLAALGDRGRAAATRRGGEVGKLVKELRGEIDWVVMKALAFKRQDRYGSAADLAEDLRRIFRDEPVSVGPPSWTYRLGKLARRRRGAVALGLAVVLAALGAVAGLAVGLQRALQAEARATAESEVARRVSDFLVDAFRAGDPSLHGAPVSAQDIVDRAARRIDQDLAEESEIRARLSLVLAEASMNLGELDRAKSLVTDGVELLTETVGLEAAETSAARNQQAFVLLSAGELDAAEGLFRELIDLETSRRPGGELEARARNDLGIVLMRRGQPAEAEPHFRRALEIHRRRGAETGREAIRALHNFSGARRDQGAFDEAVEGLREVLRLQHEVMAPPNTDIATTLNELASTVRRLGDLDEAEKLYREALAQRQSILPPDHPDVAQSLNNVGSARYWAKDYEEAGRYMKQAFDIWQVSYGGDHPRLVASLSNLGAVARRGGAFERSEDYLEQALAMETRIHEEDHVRVGAAWRRLGDTQLAAGWVEKAMDNLERGFSMLERLAGPSDSQTVTAGLSLAEAYRAAERPEAAKDLLDRLERVAAESPDQLARIREARGLDVEPSPASGQ
ncbi:MAG: serine/threonine-protein kinase [Acidobacteriota bacterium]